MMNVNNIPNYAETKKYIVAREVDGEFWFWGAFDDSDKANEVANNICGVVVRNA